MNRVSGTSVLIAAAATIFAHAGNAAAGDCPVLLGCAGMELAQDAAPNEDAPDADPQNPPSNADPDNGSSGDGGAQSPGDDGAGEDDGSGSGQASPPDTAQPPGCIFQDGPLELLV